VKVNWPSTSGFRLIGRSLALHLLFKSPLAEGFEEDYAAGDRDV
jgi:hypothetical protein